jgi:hypothetical protein
MQFMSAAASSETAEKTRAELAEMIIGLAPSRSASFSLQAAVVGAQFSSWPAG